ncbi:MAG TPA: glycosyltransferase [Solirubrobacteraceae bacterium]|nr:glycosyltransferase [Solirubrobacteraceae bacterium]
MKVKRFLFVMWEGGGNVPMQLGVARKLVARGHEVRVLAEPSIEEDVRAAGATFASFTNAPHRSERSRESDFFRDWDAKTPIGAFAAARDNLMLGPAKAYALDTTAEIDRFEPDVLAADWTLTGAAVAGEAAGVRTALLVHGVSLIPEPGKPAPGFGFTPASSALGRARDRAFVALFMRLFNKGLPALNDARRSFGLEPLADVLAHMGRQERLLFLCSEGFDFPAETPAANVRYVGPILEQPAWAQPWTSPWAPGDRRPLVVVSMSTTFMSQERALQRCTDAVRAMGVRTLVTVGPTLDPASFRGSENVVVVRSAPHDQVFAQASAVVTHAGMGTVTRALAHGVPLVCMPMGRDQDDVAVRVRYHGAGLRVGHGASAMKIRRALDRVLRDPSFREGAGRLRAVIEDDVKADRDVAELEALAAEDRASSAAGMATAARQ